MEGINYITHRRTPIKVLYGFQGVRITFALIPVRIADYRGNGVPNVRVIAQNSAGPFEGITDSNGGVFLHIEEGATVRIEKDMIVNEEIYQGEASPTYNMDLPFMQN